MSMREMARSVVLRALAACVAIFASKAALADVSGAENVTQQVSQVTQSVPVFTTASTVDDYLSYAFDHSPALQAADGRALAAKERAGRNGYLPEPQLTYSHMLEQHDKQYSIGIAQQIPAFGTLRLERQVASLAADAVEQDSEALRLMIFERVIKGFYEYHYLGRSIEIVKENVDLLADIEKVLLTRFKSNEAEYADVLKIQVERDRARNRLASLEEMRPVLSGGLASLLGLPTGTVLPWPDATHSDGGTLPADVLMDMLEMLNPELRASNSRIESLRAAVALARRSKLPSFALGFEYVQMSEMEDGAEPQDYGIQAGISIPLWHGKYNAATREAELERAAEEQARQQLEADLQVELRQALFELRDAQRKIELLNSSLVPKARQSFAVTRNEFQSGASTFMALIDAQRTLLDLSLELARARADLEIALGEIGCCVGRYDLKALGIKERGEEK